MPGINRRNAIRLLLLAVGGSALCLRFGGCNRNPSSAELDESNTVEAKHVGKFRFLALGDSYTIGESVLPADRWPVQLADRLRSGGIDVGDPLIIARTGWTTADLLAALDTAKLTEKFDLVTILIGVNNQYQGRSQDEYQQQFVQLLHRGIELADGNAGHVVVLSIPDWGVTPFGREGDVKHVAAAIDQFNQINREETAKTTAAYVDITPISRRAAMQPDQFADDGLHPTRQQYADWTNAALNSARAAITQSQHDGAAVHRD